jgi:hypothetical protein
MSARRSATAGCFGVAFAGMLLGAEGPTGASLSVTGAGSWLFDPNRLRTELSMPPRATTRTGMPLVICRKLQLLLWLIRSWQLRPRRGHNQF